MRRYPGAVIGLCFGTRPLDGPDPVNEELADLCWEVAGIYRIPVLAQEEIGSRMPECDMRLPSGRKCDTRGALDHASAWCLRRGIRDVALVAGSFHLWRATQTARKLRLRVVLVRTTSNTWDPESQQWWTRSPWLNIPREFVACMYYKIRGWI